MIGTKKRMLSLLLCALLLASLSACGSSKSYPLNTNGEYVTKGIYAYYLNEVVSYPSEYGVEKGDEAQVQAAAQNLCMEYVTTKDFMSRRGIEFAQYYKRETATQTEKIWGMFGNYYKQIGVEKADITEVISHEQRKDQLVEYYYGTDGQKPYDEAQLKEDFVDMYIGFKAIEAPLTRETELGEIVDLTDKEKEALESEMRSMATQLNDKKSTIDELNEKFNLDRGLVVTGTLPLAVIKDNDPMYDKDFFSKVNDITHDYARFIESDTSYYVVLRQKIATDDEDAFIIYRQQVLNELKMPNIEKLIDSFVENLSVDVEERMCDEIYDTILAVKN